MTSDTIILHGIPTKVYSVNTVIVGTGAAGYNAAKQLWDMGQKDIAILTEKRMPELRGTSALINRRTTRSPSVDGDGQPWENGQKSQRRWLYGRRCGVGGGGHVRTGLYNLTESGVPFPRNQYGSISDTAATMIRQTGTSAGGYFQADHGAPGRGSWSERSPSWMAIR
ncbi:MAG: hypothetical protein ACLTXL_08985 [Clostridia bacterium]